MRDVKIKYNKACFKKDSTDKKHQHNIIVKSDDKLCKKLLIIYGTRQLGFMTIFKYFYFQFLVIFIEII